MRGLLLIGTKTLVLNSAMSGLATGYVIPKLKVSDLVTPVAHGGPGGVALGVPLLDDDDNRRQTRKHFALIYGARCIYCKDFHNPNLFCFRLKTISLHLLWPMTGETGQLQVDV